LIGKMLNRGPAKWREWRWNNLTIPLYIPDPKAPVPEGQLPFSQCVHMSVAALKEKEGCIDTLKENLEKLVKEPDSPGGRVHEDRFRDMLKATCKEVLSADQIEDIFPSPPPPEDSSLLQALQGAKAGSRRPSKVGRMGSKQGSKMVRKSSKEPPAAENS